DGIRDYKVTGVQTCALPIFFSRYAARRVSRRRFGTNRCSLRGLQSIGPLAGERNGRHRWPAVGEWRYCVCTCFARSGKLRRSGRSEERRVGKEGGWGEARER